MVLIDQVRTTFTTEGGRVFGIVLLVFLSLLFLGLMLRVIDVAAAAA